MAFGPSVSLSGVCPNTDCFHPAPAQVADPAQSVQGLVLMLLLHGSDFLPWKRGFLFIIQYFQGLVSANIQYVLS